MHTFSRRVGGVNGFSSPIVDAVCLQESVFFGPASRQKILETKKILGNTP